MTTLTYTTTMPYDAHFTVIGSLVCTVREQYMTRHTAFIAEYRRRLIRDNIIAIRALRGATMNIVK